MKKLSTILLVSGLVVSLTACGANNNNTRTNAYNGTGTTTSSTTNTTGTNTYGTNTYGTNAGTYGTNTYGTNAGTYGTGANTYGTGTYGATTRATDTTTPNRGGNWGWLGLLGLAGLAGRGRSKDPDPQRQDVSLQGKTLAWRVFLC